MKFIQVKSALPGLVLCASSTGHEHCRALFRLANGCLASLKGLLESQWAPALGSKPQQRSEQLQASGLPCSLAVYGRCQASLDYDLLLPQVQESAQLKYGNERPAASG